METKVIYREPIGNAKRKYRQDNLVISTFKACTRNIRQGIEHCKELGFDMVEFGWVNPQDSLKCMVACEEVGIDGIFQNWEIFGGFGESRGRREVSTNEIQGYLEQTGKYRHVRGYYIWDEPLKKETMELAGELLKVIEQSDPWKLPYTVALPGDNSYGRNWENDSYEQYLTEYVELIQPAVVSLDHYPFKPGKPEAFDQLDSCTIYADLALLRRLSLDKKIPMWYYFQSQDDPWKGTYYGFTPEKVRMQQYLALLHGAKGLQSYNVYPGALNADGTKGPLFYTTRELNHHTHQMGKTLMALTSVGVYHSPEVLKDAGFFEKYRQRLTDSRILAGEELPFRCSAGEFTDCEENDYLFVQNRDYYESRSFELPLKKEFRVYEVSKEDGGQRLRSEHTDRLILSLQPGDAMLLRFQDAAKEAYLIDYVLKK